jgi:small subunit ribosomal protein S6
MQTQRYEALILTVPEVTNDEAAELEKSIEKKLQDQKSKLVTYDRWGKFLLAYPVKKNEYGIYFLARFDIPIKEKNAVIKELKSLFDLKFNAVVMRYVVCNIANDASTVYKRPQSLDEMPKDVDQFLKENKMSGLGFKRQYQRSGEGFPKREWAPDQAKQEETDKE